MGQVHVVPRGSQLSGGYFKSGNVQSYNNNSVFQRSSKGQSKDQGPFGKSAWLSSVLAKQFDPKDLDFHSKKVGADENENEGADGNAGTIPTTDLIAQFPLAEIIFFSVLASAVVGTVFVMKAETVMTPFKRTLKQLVMSRPQNYKLH